MRPGAKRRERSGVPVDALLVGYGTSETIPHVPLVVGREYRTRADGRSVQDGRREP